MGRQWADAVDHRIGLRRADIGQNPSVLGLETGHRVALAVPVVIAEQQRHHIDRPEPGQRLRLARGDATAADCQVV